VAATTKTLIEKVEVPIDPTLPLKWDWEVREHGDKEYITPFPCQVKLKRNEGVTIFEE
jgi:hypothetical protein